MKKSNIENKYKYKEYLPSVKLKKHIEKIWVFDSVSKIGEDIQFHLIPDYTSSLILIVPTGYASIKGLPKLFFTGPTTVNYPIDNTLSQITIGFRFYPLQLHALFGIEPAKIYNSSVNLKDFLEPRDFKNISQKIINSGTTRSKIEVINSLILKFSNSVKFSVDEISSAIDMIIAAEGKIKLENIYSGLTISQRQFQRNFIKRTGLTPKEFCKLLRFHMVTRKLVKNNFRHFDTLVESGYYDQSHYYREFKEFLGMLPGKFEIRQKKITHEKLLE